MSTAPVILYRYVIIFWVKFGFKHASRYDASPFSHKIDNALTLKRITHDKVNVYNIQGGSDTLTLTNLFTPQLRCLLYYLDPKLPNV